jgi:hypothetical protein
MYNKVKSQEPHSCTINDAKYAQNMGTHSVMFKEEMQYGKTVEKQVIDPIIFWLLS